MAATLEELEERVEALELIHWDMNWMANNMAWATYEPDILHWITGDVYTPGEWVENTTPIIDDDLHAAILVAIGLGLGD